MALNPRILSWAGRTVWLVGASTGIGRATASRLHALGARVVVSARSQEALDRFVAEHPRSDAIALDATDREAMHDAAAHIVNVHGRIDLAVYCAGTYRAMRATDFDFDVAQQHVHVNYTGALVMLDAVLPHVLAQAKAGDPKLGAGHISLVSSVAGFRGLPQSLAYGPTKAALINLAETMYLDLQPLGVGVSLINPGFVETPLTAQNAFKMPALISPEAAAKAIVRGWEGGQFEIHFPKRFTLWLKGLRLLPYSLYFAAVRRSTGL
ncbi:MAG: SDR family NAD(P)-dependent oxidoreductase [Rubrivivax sp.]|nr:SDR family NAD(P)-dependent oxidoreductase [Rubrivivax sp.]MDP3612161.1 SDR family NAD(P)-dependent oxidoreductase [Rubrivivax sp.]